MELLNKVKEKVVNATKVVANVVEAGAVNCKSLKVDAGGINIGGVTLTAEDIKKLKNM